MKIIDRMLDRLGFERRAAAEPSWAALSGLAGGAPLARNAESVSAVYACVSAISETIASLPLILYRRTDDDGRDRARDHPLYKVLHDTPNGQQSALEFREQMQASVLLRGNAFAEIVRGYDGQARELRPLLADRVQVLKLDNGRLAYEVAEDRGVVDACCRKRSSTCGTAARTALSACRPSAPRVRWSSSPSPSVSTAARSSATAPRPAAC